MRFSALRSLEFIGDSVHSMSSLIRRLNSHHGEQADIAQASVSRTAAFVIGWALVTFAFAFGGCAPTNKSDQSQPTAKDPNPEGNRNKKAQQLYESIRSAAAEHLKKMRSARGALVVLSDLESPPGTIARNSDDSYSADEWIIDLQRGHMQKVYFPESDEVYSVHVWFDPASSKIVDVDIAVDLVDLKER